MYEFMSEEDCFDYLDAMYNDGVECETLIEDHLTGEFEPAQDISMAFQRTWREIEQLP